MGNLSTPKSVQKLQTALYVKAKVEAGYHFYAPYDKLSRDDILAHAYAQCRSSKGAPGIDGQDFADIEAYGVERWLAELTLAIREETYRPEPIRRVHILKANGKLRTLGISTVWDRVCMTAAMLVLEPIFEADLPPEIYAYRAGRNAQQAVIEMYLSLKWAGSGRDVAMRNVQDLKARLRTDLKAAILRRHAAEVTVLRSLIAAIDDAQAVPVSKLHETYVVRAFGDPSVEVPRRELGTGDLRQLLESEREVRLVAAEEYRVIGRNRRAEELTVAANIVARYLDE